MLGSYLQGFTVEERVDLMWFFDIVHYFQSDFSNSLITIQLNEQYSDLVQKGGISVFTKPPLTSITAAVVSSDIVNQLQIISRGHRW